MEAKQVVWRRITACRAVCRSRQPGGVPSSRRSLTAIATSSYIQQRGSLVQSSLQSSHLPGPSTCRPFSSSAATLSSSGKPSSESGALRSPLHDFHLAHGAKMIPFGGYSMPVLYNDQSLAESHVFTRAHASLFDVSHMVQRLVAGPGAARFLQRVTPSDVERGLPEGRSTLSALMHPTGGIVDDCVIVRLPGGAAGQVFADGNEGDVFYIVTNAACREKDDAYLEEQIRAWNEKNGKEGLEARHVKVEDRGLVALQGPDAAAVLAGVLVEPSFGSLETLLFGHSGSARIRLGNGQPSAPVLISRGGYTGEDGFEISVAGDDTVPVTEVLCETSKGEESRVRLAGLGARDSLRLEAGMCLYGHDLDDSTTPGEAGLGWIVAKDRRGQDPESSFLGAKTVLPQLVPKSKGGAGVERRRVGLTVEGAPAREGAEILDAESGESIGSVTSGCPSPTLSKNIAMGYVKDGFHKAGTEVSVVVRGKRRKATVTKMPFAPTRYWKG